MTDVAVADLTVSYNGTPVVDRLSVRILAGTWLGLIGPNGAGKTTFLRAIAGLVPFAGEIRLGGTSISVFARRRLAQVVAFVPQRPTTPEAMTVTDYVLTGRTPYISYLGMESRNDLDVVAQVIERLELGELAHRSLGSLSGGELQRAVLGRALAQRAPILLLDEPTAALDVGHQQQVLELVDALRIEQALTVISAMHDLTLAGQFAQELLLVDRGRWVAGGPARRVLTEETIRRHYGASVRVVSDSEGGVVVLPTRRDRTPAVAHEPGVPACEGIEL